MHPNTSVHLKEDVLVASTLDLAANPMEVLMSWNRAARRPNGFISHRIHYFIHGCLCHDNKVRQEIGRNKHDPIIYRKGCRTTGTLLSQENKQANQPAMLHLLACHRGPQHSLIGEENTVTRPC